MAFADALGVIACRCATEGGEVVRYVSHAGGDWQMYCHWTGHDFTSPDVLRDDLAFPDGDDD